MSAVTLRRAVLGRIYDQQQPERLTAAELAAITSPGAMTLPGFAPPPIDTPARKAAPVCPLFEQGEGE